MRFLIALLILQLVPRWTLALTHAVHEIGRGRIPSIITEDAYQIEGVVYPYVDAQGRSYLNDTLPPNAQVFLLVHGLMENSRVWRDLGSELTRLGQVFMINVRGHGRGAHRSLPIRGRSRGAEGTDAMSVPGGDIDTAMRMIHRLSGRKVVLMGHSNGGMVARQWLRGAVSLRNDGSPHPERAITGFSESLATEHASLVKFYGEFGSPPHFRDLHSGYRRFAQLLPDLGRRQGDLVLYGSGDHVAPTTDVEHGVIGNLMTQTMRSVDPFLFPSIAPEGAVVSQNLTLEELRALREKAYSAAVPWAILSDFQRYARSGAWVSRAGVNRESSEPLKVPVVLMIGERDHLVPREALLRFGHEIGARIIEILGTGHIDLVYGERAASLVGPVMKALLEDPTFGVRDLERMQLLAQTAPRSQLEPHQRISAPPKCNLSNIALMLKKLQSR